MLRRVEAPSSYCISHMMGCKKVEKKENRLLLCVWWTSVLMCAERL